MGEKRFEDFVVGETLVSPGRTIEAADINLFAGLTGDFYPIHVDEVVAAETQFGGRIAHGPLTFAIAVGLVGLSGWLGDAIVALVEVQSIKARKPVRPGDTVRVKVTVTGTDEARRPEHGTVRLHYSVRNQTDDEVMTVTMVMLARRREPALTTAGGGAGAPTERNVG